MHQYTILHWYSSSSYGTLESRDNDDPDSIEAEYIDKLFEYRSVLGVSAVRKDNKIITWELNDSWYSSNEIERMLKLKTFS